MSEQAKEQAQKVEEIKQESESPELSENDLEKVAGGGGCAAGVHYPSATISPL